MKLKFVSLIVILFLLTGCSSSENNSEGSSEGKENIVHITESNYESEVVFSDKPVLIDFYADWCGPCQMMAPHLEEIAAERTDIKIAKINVDEETSLASMYGITAMPTLVFIKDGAIVQRAVGYRSKSQILAIVSE